MTLSIPRDRAGTFDPKLIAKYQRRFPDFDDKIISMYARGMTVRETRGHLEELYGIDVSPDLISAVTDAVLEEVAEWQNGPLDAVSISAVFPQTVVQTCIVHLIRHSLEFVSWKDRKLVVPALRAIYRAKDAEAGMKALEEFEAGYWGQKYPAITQSWRRNWDHVVPFFAFPESVRRIIYTTNQIEALNSKLRRAVRTRGHFPNDDAAMKLLYLVLNHVAEEWKRPPREWFEGQDPVRRPLRRKVRQPVTKPASGTEFLTVPAWLQAASTAGSPSCSTAPRMLTICRSPSSTPASLRLTRAMPAGSTQSLKGAPLRSAPGLRASTGT